MARRRRFGAPPIWHRKQARTLAVSLRRHVRLFNAAMRRGECSAAFPALLTVSALGSAYYRERVGLRHGELLAKGAMNPGRSLPGTASTRGKMLNRFLRSCAVVTRIWR